MILRISLVGKHFPSQSATKFRNGVVFCSGRCSVWYRDVCCLKVGVFNLNQTTLARAFHSSPGFSQHYQPLRHENLNLPSSYKTEEPQEVEIAASTLLTPWSLVSWRKLAMTGVEKKVTYLGTDFQSFGNHVLLKKERAVSVPKTTIRMSTTSIRISREELSPTT